MVLDTPYLDLLKALHALQSMEPALCWRVVRGHVMWRLPQVPAQGSWQYFDTERFLHGPLQKLLTWDILQTLSAHVKILQNRFSLEASISGGRVVSQERGRAFQQIDVQLHPKYEAVLKAHSEDLDPRPRTFLWIAPTADGLDRYWAPTEAVRHPQHTGHEKMAFLAQAPFLEKYLSTGVCSVQAFGPWMVAMVEKEHSFQVIKLAQRAVLAHPLGAFDEDATRVDGQTVCGAARAGTALAPGRSHPFASHDPV